YKNFSFARTDITQRFSLPGRVDAICHLASAASPKDYLKFPLETLKAGSAGTLNLLELARKKRAIFLLASTSEVYGDPKVSPQRENYWGNVNCIGPRSCYDEAKRFSEALTIAYHRKYSLEVRIARIFNTFGPRMKGNDGRAIPTFIGQSLKNEDLTVFGKGDQTRSFCYISDLIEGIYRLLKSKEPRPINLGNPSEMKIVDLAKKVIALSKSKSSLVYKPLPVDDPKRRCPDIKRAKELLGWQPKVNLEEGLKRTIAWFRSL
ncbi:MAG: GDP-mannose 4,6-dehydratase, partial [Candidatus Omnitrophica bacterium]|nr:GDP-mannose 4,6-dehydratase [Candidatus Omnitrophota bacterium]